jgi:hypothetical protein
LSQYSRYPGVPFVEGPRTIDNLELFACLKGPDQNYKGHLQLGSFMVRHAPWPDMACFVMGGWFEEYVYEKALALKEKGLVKALRKNLFAMTGEGSAQEAFQEFDLAMTDGYFLTIVECKAGEVNQSHVQKLENLRQRFGGHFGRGVLVVADRKRLDSVRERITRSQGVCAITGDALSKNPELLLSCKPGMIIEP